MAILIVCSAFFSASEAALFYLRPRDRRALKSGTRSERTAARLLSNPDRLLSAVLFWNLVINITYFAISSICAIRFERDESVGQAFAIGFALFSLLIIIFCSEMVPKSIAVLKPRVMAKWLSLPLSLAVRLVDPIMPVLRAINLGSRRLFWPGFRNEEYMLVSDLERAFKISVDEEKILKQEQTVLQNIVQLSDIRVDEWMRPRTQFMTFSPPVSLRHLNGKVPPSGYLLITEPESEEIEKAVRLDEMFELPEENLDELGTPVICLPWSTNVATAMEKMIRKDRDVTAVVNEFGETIGILTIEDILETIFNYEPSRLKRLLDENPIHFIDKNKWVVAGMVSLRRLSRILQVEIPKSQSITVSGIIQESIQRLAEVGDTCSWGPFELKVIEIPHRGHMLVELQLNDSAGPNS
ncbi:CNNM domain-containing protein [Vicingaceae bacterium]|nr:CNNM domain-containing protein [Vicingaceae bacterium]